MSTITSLTGSTPVTTAGAATIINTNFANLNTDKIETSVLDTDNTLTANSDSKIATQKATKTYVDSVASPVGKSWNEYAVDAVGTDSYAITVAGVTAYVAGQTFKFKAGTANTGACTLNVNGLGAKTIKKSVSTDLATGDILASQVVVVVYDGTNMQMVASPSIPATDIQTFTGNGTWTKPAGTPIMVHIECWGGGGSGGKSQGCGGGGGAYVQRWLVPSLMGSTETVTIGAGGIAVSSNGAGNNGGNTTVGSLITAYGGGAGGSASYGGGGGGALGLGNAITQGSGGSPSIQAAGGFGYGGATVSGNDNADGGGGGQGTGAAGGASVNGGAGGGGFGGGGASPQTGNSVNGGAGGGGIFGTGTITQAGGVSVNGGNGGASSVAGTATTGSVPGGGGGGTHSGTSGAGGAGKCVVTTFF